MTNKNLTTATGEFVLPPISYTQCQLANGLRVIFHQDRAIPIVAVNIWYHVGSKNEVPGRTGFAHLFEHMMFQGSKHYDDDFFIPLQEAGGTLNGSTNADRTNYWEVVPANFLELALWLESDRMGYLLDAMTDEKLDNQRAVVKNEKRQNYDNRPYGLVSARIAEAMYPPDHPYHWLTIGSLDDLNAASMGDVQDFFRRFYVPNNASLTIAGDFDEAEARLVEKYFGPVKPGPQVEAVSARQPQLERERRITMDDRVQLPRVYLAGTRRRNGARTTRFWMCSPACWPAAKARASTNRWSTSAKRPRMRAPFIARAKSPDYSKSFPPPSPIAPLQRSRRSSMRKWRRLERRRRPLKKCGELTTRSRPRLFTACKQSAGSAEKATSLINTLCS
ncbi:MAG: pitrilysin family protein [Pyrinomonadaceae bacterium]